MKLVVTGGLGFIGSHFVTSAYKEGHEIIVLDKLTYAGRLENLSTEILDGIQLHIIDIANSENVRGFFDGMSEVDWIINFAAESHVDRSIVDSLPFIDSNVRGVVNLLETLRHGVVKNLLQVSTDEVYGSIRDGSWTEDSLVAPRSPYSASKASAELMCLSYMQTYGVNVLITRCANNFGSKQAPEKFLPTIFSSLFQGKSIPVYGDGNNRREWIHVRDHVSAIMKLINLENPKKSIYNIGGKEFSNLELVDMISGLFGFRISPVEFVKDRLGHDFRYSLIDEQIRTETSWTPSEDFMGDLMETLEWYKSNELWLDEGIKRLKL